MNLFNLKFFTGFMKLHWLLVKELNPHSKYPEANGTSFIILYYVYLLPVFNSRKLGVKSAIYHSAETPFTTWSPKLKHKNNEQEMNDKTHFKKDTETAKQCADI